MGRPINKRFLGDFNEPGFQISAVVNVDVGEGAEPGYILRQRSNSKYLVEGVNSGETAVCSLVAKLAPALGEMSVSVLSDVKGLALLKDGQDEGDYDGTPPNGSFVAGSGYAASDTVTLSDGSVITVDAIDAALELDSGQTEADFDGAGDNGTFVAGSGYSADDEITLSNDDVIKVDTVDGGGEVLTFTVLSVNGTAVSGTPLTQDSVDPTGGTGFTLTPGDDNLISLGNVTEFTVTSVGDVFQAGTTLTQDQTSGGGSQFTLTPGVANRDAKPEFARIINNRTVKTFLGNVYAWPENVDTVGRPSIDIQGE